MGRFLRGDVDMRRFNGMLTRLVLQPYRETALNAAGSWTVHRTAVARAPEAGRVLPNAGHGAV